MDKKLEEEYLDWLESERANGLRDIKLTVAPGATREEIIREMLEINKAIKEGRHRPIVDLDEEDVKDFGEGPIEWSQIE